mgnify:FL=1
MIKIPNKGETNKTKQKAIKQRHQKLTKYGVHKDDRREGNEKEPERRKKKR